jgi:hypothetical protein
MPFRNVLRGSCAVVVICTIAWVIHAKMSLEGFPGVTGEKLKGSFLAAKRIGKKIFLSPSTTQLKKHIPDTHHSKNESQGRMAQSTSTNASDEWPKQISNSSLLAVAAVEQGPRTQIILTVGGNYLDFFLNWWATFSRLLPKLRGDINFAVLCYDDISMRVVEALGIRCTRMKRIPNVRMLWWTRFKVAKQLLSRGFEVILTDSDALWVRNPVPVFDAMRTVDIVASVGRVFGHPFFCMGLICLRPSNATMNVLAMVMSDGSKVRDDQQAMNQEMRKCSAQDQGAYEKHAGRASGSKMVQNVVNTSILGTFAHGGTYVRVPLRYFQRHCDDMNEARRHGIVLHCLAPKSSQFAADKRVHMLSQGLWVLKKDALAQAKSLHYPYPHTSTYDGTQLKDQMREKHTKTRDVPLHGSATEPRLGQAGETAGSLVCADCNLGRGPKKGPKRTETRGYVLSKSRGGQEGEEEAVCDDCNLVERFRKEELGLRVRELVDGVMWSRFEEQWLSVSVGDEDD